MTISKLVGLAGAVLLVLAVFALPVSAAGNQYSGTKDCPNCPENCDPNEYANEYNYLEPGPHGTQSGTESVEPSGAANGEPIQHQFKHRFRYSTGAIA